MTDTIRVHFKVRAVTGNPIEFGLLASGEETLTRRLNSTRTDPIQRKGISHRVDSGSSPPVPDRLQPRVEQLACQSVSDQTSTAERLLPHAHRDLPDDVELQHRPLCEPVAAAGAVEVRAAARRALLRAQGEAPEEPGQHRHHILVLYRRVLQPHHHRGRGASDRFVSGPPGPDHHR